MSDVEFPDHLAPPLRQLRQALRYAAEQVCQPWDFAVEVQELKAAGGTLTDVRWLVAKGLVEHREELTQPGDAVRSFRPLSPVEFPERTCLILTDAGCGLLDTFPLLAPSPLSSAPSSSGSAVSLPVAASISVPSWDRNTRELRFQGVIIKRYHVPAACQEQVLDAFEEEGWPEWIDDPLPPVQNIDGKRRLSSTIKALNRNQAKALLRFHSNGQGRVVFWRPRNNPPSPGSALGTAGWQGQ